MKSIQKFKKVLERYPQSPQAYKATFTLGRMYHRLAQSTGNRSDSRTAREYYNRLLNQYDKGRLSDDAQFYLGELYARRKENSLARQAFQKVLTHYPEGDHVALARKRLRTLPEEKNAGRQASRNSKSNLKKTTINNLSFSRMGNHSKIVLSSSGPLDFTEKHLQDPSRVYFDFNDSRWAEPIPEDIPVNDGLVSKIRLNGEKGQTRLVLDLETHQKLRIQTRKRERELVIELIPFAKPVAVKTKAKAAAPKVKQVQAAATPPKATMVSKDKQVVVIDAGHGGKDDGAHGAHGVLEKTINLKVSKRVAEILKTRYKYHVILTRVDDTFLELRERGEIANKNGADLFVSIHANAAPRKSAEGIETYYLGTGSTEQALATAARENGELVGSVADDEVQEILASLISTTKINDSSRLAATVQRRLFKTLSKKYNGLVNLGVKEGPFFVLHDTNMPSILVEVGFVTNNREERRLKNQKYQYWLAESIAQGIHDFLKQKAPSI